MRASKLGRVFRCIQLFRIIIQGRNLYFFPQCRMMTYQPKENGNVAIISKKKTAEANGEYFNAKFAVRGRFVEEIRW